MLTDDDDDEDAWDFDWHDPRHPDLGPCCCCGLEGDDVRNIVMLARRAPVPGTGWGCVACGLPPDGASYVACDRCLEDEREPREVIAGFAISKGRTPIDSLPAGAFDHDMTRHPGEV
jgi:hypothetical protein